MKELEKEMLVNSKVEVEVEKLASGMKAGFSMIEIALVVVVIGVMSALFLPNIISGKDRAVISSTVSNDIKLIGQALTEWKSSSSQSDGTYSNITSISLTSYLPKTMGVVGGKIFSSGFNGGIAYEVISDNVTTTGDSFKIFADGTIASSAQNWDNRMKTFFETTVINTVVSMSTNKANLVETPLASALGGKDVAMTSAGSIEDGMAGVRRIKY